MKRKIFLALFLFAFAAQAQVPSNIRRIRLPLWAELDAYPGLAQAQDTSAGVFDYSIGRLKQTAPFLISGMVYGWNFSYTPSDTMRGVKEFLEVTEIQTAEQGGISVEYTSPWIENNRVNCWCEYTRTDFQVQNYNLWASIQHPVLHGRGYGNISDGFDGLRAAADDALKNAVREHYRSIIKNKPKEIRGAVLIRGTPTIGIASGKYVINLDFFLESGKIIEYTQF